MRPPTPKVHCPWGSKRHHRTHLSLSRNAIVTACVDPWKKALLLNLTNVIQEGGMKYVVSFERLMRAYVLSREKDLDA
jgi:hypothetical protein